MLKKLREKLNDKKGTTIGEVLVCVLILTLASGLLVGGIVLASNNFEKSFSHSQAQVISSTLMSAVENELRYTTSVKGSGDDFTFSRPSSKEYVKFAQQEGRVVLSVDDTTYYELVSPGTYSHSLKGKVIVDSVTMKEEGSSQVMKITVTINITKGDSADIVETSTFDVFPINHANAVTE